MLYTDHWSLRPHVTCFGSGWWNVHSLACAQSITFKASISGQRNHVFRIIPERKLHRWYTFFCRKRSNTNSCQKDSTYPNFCITVRCCIKNTLKIWKREQEEQEKEEKRIRKILILWYNQKGNILTQSAFHRWTHFN